MHLSVFVIMMSTGAYDAPYNPYIFIYKTDYLMTLL